MRQGLYDPANERDACGLGFIAHIKGQKRHAIITQALSILKNLSHRGATGADPLQGDGAGILIQLPDRFLRRVCGAQGLTLPAIGQYGVGMVFLPKEPASRMACVQEIERAIASEGQVLLGWRDVPTNNAGLSLRTKEVEPVIRQVFIARGSRDGPGCARAQALHHPQEIRPRDPGAQASPRQGVLRSVDVVANARLQGDAARAPGRRVFRRSHRREHGVGARDGSPALLDEHVPDVGSRASVPAGVPQRRDQHAARKRQLDSRAPAGDREHGARRRPRQDLAAHLRRPIRFGVVRQRARAAADGRLSARARDDADDPRGVGRQSADGRGPARVLRIPRRADGAVGRSRGDGVHRRPPDRRDARPQRAAARALRRHRRRLHRHGERGRRARHPRAQDRQEVAAAAGQDAARRHAAGPHHRRRRVEAHARHRRSRIATGSRARGSRSTSCPRRRRRSHRKCRCSTGNRRSATRRRICGSSWRRWPRAARKRSARWATTRRCRCSRIGRRRCTAISSSSSRR